MNLALSEQAIGLHRQGRVPEAERLYAQILAADPHDLGTLYNHGTALLDMGRLEEALASFGRALAIKPDLAEALNNCASILRALGRPGEALARYDQALAAEPANAGIWYNRGAALLDMARLAEALESFDKALAIRPDFAEAFNNRGFILLKMQRHQEALASFDRALAINPGMAIAWNNRGNALRTLERGGEALASFEKALALDPGQAEVWNSAGGALREMNRLEEALASFHRALAIDPDHAEALYNRGNLEWTANRRLEPALRDLEKAALIDPEAEYVRGDRLHLRMHGGEWKDFAWEADAIHAGVRAGKRIVEPFAYQALSDSPADLMACARIHARHRWPARPMAPAQRYRHAKIRIGYLSGEFREQATAYLTAGLYEHHDKDKFEIVAFDNGGSDGSPIRKRLEAAFDKFIDISRLSDSAAAERIRAEEIDILVNLNGYFGLGRSGVFARRPAPVQVNYLGFPGTMGADYMDYILADRIVIPEQERQFYAEEVVWLPDSYQANDCRRPIAAAPGRDEAGLPAGGFVFCNFNQSYKLTPAMFAAWLRILRGAEGSVLWLLEGNPRFAGNLRREAAEHGVAPERLVFAPRMPPEMHLARLKLADLFLDSLPYNAHTTASDALWAGLPLITCRGKSFPGRVGASLLQAAGLPQLIAETMEEYETLALRLAGDAALLKPIRDRLERERLRLPLFDTGAFTRHIEAAYVEMYRRWQQGEKARSFAVSRSGA